MPTKSRTRRRSASPSECRFDDGVIGATSIARHTVRSGIAQNQFHLTCTRQTLTRQQPSRRKLADSGRPGRTTFNGSQEKPDMKSKSITRTSNQLVLFFSPGRARCGPKARWISLGAPAAAENRPCAPTVAAGTDKPDGVAGTRVNQPASSSPGKPEEEEAK